MMHIRTAVASFSVSTLLFVASSFAQKAMIEGNAADEYGRALNKASVRLQRENSNSAATIVETNAKGQFVAANLPAGKYNVSVSVRGNVKWSAANVKAANGQVARVNLGGKQIAAASQPKKRAVWIPDQTGSRLGGHWEDQPVPSSGANNVDSMSPDQLNRIQNLRQAPLGSGGR